MAAPGDVAARVAALMQQARDDLARLVGYRSVADPAVEPVEECARAAEAVSGLLAATGVDGVRSLRCPDGSAAVYGHTPGPPGTPTVLLYAHYDVQPAGSAAAWSSPPFSLTERDGRWYGRGAADCKGNIAMHLTALRALGDRFPVGVKVVVEGSEEQPTEGLQSLVASEPDLFAADAVVVADCGNVAVGVPTLTTSLRGSTSVRLTVRTLERPVHSGQFGGAAPDALAALVAMLATLRDAAGATSVRGLAGTQSWSGAAYETEQFRRDAGVLPGVDVVGGAPVADLLWARPALTVLGVDCPSVDEATPAVQGTVRALLNLRVPPGTDPRAAQDALVGHLEAVAPWGAHVDVERLTCGAPVTVDVEGPAAALARDCLAEAFGRPVVTSGQGGSIPLVGALAGRLPQAELLLLGVEEPLCSIHAPDESVDPAEIERMAVAEALLLQRLGRSRDLSPRG